MRAGGWQGWVFIGKDDLQSPRAVQVEGSFYIANRWSALPDFLSHLENQGVGLDEETALVIDMDKTSIGARGRNDKNNTGHEARFEEESAAFHEKVRQGYLEIARREPGRVKVIEAAGSLEEIQAAVRATVDRAMAL